MDAIITVAEESKQFNMELPSYFPADIPLRWPLWSDLPETDQHYLVSIPWDKQYLQLVPVEYRAFFTAVRPYLSERTTDVHTAVCLQYLDEFIDQAQATRTKVNRHIVAYALILHDCGWSALSATDIAASLGVTGLALNPTAQAPKAKHAQLGAQIARRLLTAQQSVLHLSADEIDTIGQCILYHDQPEKVAGWGQQVPIEMQLLVDLDHLWSFTHLNFWLDTVRKGVEPSQYVENLRTDLNSYFVTAIGKRKAQELLAARAQEVSQSL
jgi:hypothetical protein